MYSNPWIAPCRVREEVIVTDPEDERADLEEARRALAAAETASVETDLAAASLAKVSESIRLQVEPNGYVLRFRAMLRGA